MAWDIAPLIGNSILTKLPPSPLFFFLGRRTDCKFLQKLVLYTGQKKIKTLDLPGQGLSTHLLIKHYFWIYLLLECPYLKYMLKGQMVAMYSLETQLGTLTIIYQHKENTSPLTQANQFIFIPQRTLKSMAFMVKM